VASLQALYGNVDNLRVTKVDKDQLEVEVKGVSHSIAL